MKDFQIDQPLQFFLQQLREELGDHLKQVILFGSRARGDHVAESDYDCLVVVAEVTSKIFKAVDEVAGETLYQFDRVVSAFPVAEHDFEYKIYHPLYRNIKAEGIALFSSHHSAIGAFNKHFIKTNIFPKEFGRPLNPLFRERQTSDYEFDAMIDHHRAEEELRIAENLLTYIIDYLVSEGFINISKAGPNAPQQLI